MGITNTNESGDTTFKYSEIFHSFQGEGALTGSNTAWIRFFLCNLSCDGFGQKDPTDPSTYILPYKDLDLSNIKSVEELPVFDFGCDSSYTWAKKYRHLAHDETPFEICNNIQKSLIHPSNPDGLFRHPATKQETHMAFTGGEPLLNQPAMIAIMEEFANRDNTPEFVTVETNGTKQLKPDMIKMLKDYTGWSNMFENSGGEVHDWFWSVSPKLWSTAGEKAKKAIRPEFVAEYADLGWGQLKYVVNGSQESWDEVEHYTEMFRQAGVDWDVYIMVVGATKEQQEDDHTAVVAMEALKRGYHFSGRLHAHVMGNKVGT